VADAVRCYRLAGAHRRAADLNKSLGEYREAAADYEESGMPELAAWLLVHEVADPEAARAVIDRLGALPVGDGSGSGATSVISLRRRLVLVRCALAEGEVPLVVLPVIDEACAWLSNPTATYDRFIEEWAVAVAGHVGRYDQVSLIFAASVRGRRSGAVKRWNEWAGQVLGAEMTIPAVPEPARMER
jgi:hypothetical protein